jgi:predicted transposase YbfD/YdcC
VPASSSSPLSSLQAVSDAVPSTEPLSAVESITLLQALGSVPDPRKRRGRRHGLQSILLLALTAVQAGACSWVAIADWARFGDHGVRVCGRPPEASTFRRVLAAVDVAALETARAAWIGGRRNRAAAAEQAAGRLEPTTGRRQVIAVDGKTLRGTRTAGGPPTQLFAAYDHRHALVLTQAAIVGADEVAAFATTLDTLPGLHEVLVTADALHTQRGHADYLHGRGAHYLCTVKGNQPRLHAALAGLPWAKAPRQITRDRGHGRTESRSVTVIAADGHPALGELFPHAAQAIRVIRRRTDNRTGQRSVEVVYALTSLTHRQADLGLLAGWLQGHWGIENRVHHVRDVTQGEDASQIRAGNGPRVMAVLRNTALNLARLAGHDNIAQAQRQASWRSGDALRDVTAT